MDFEIEISLKRLSMIAYAGYFWNRPIIEDTIFEHFSSKLKHFQCDYEFLPSLMNMVMNMGLKTECLPLTIVTELHEIIFQLGLSVYDWYTSLNYMSSMLIPLKCSNRMLLDWTVYGTVDKSKAWKKWIIPIFETFEEIEPEKRRRLTFGLYRMACANIHKSYINRHSQEMIIFCVQDFGEKYEKEIFAFNRSLNFIINSVSCLADEPIYLEKIYFLDSHSYQAMFELSVEEVEVAAVQYYWDLLDLKEKENNLLCRAVICVQSYVKEFKRRDLYYQRYRSNEYLDVLIFLFKQMSMDQIEEFLSLTSVQEKLELLIGMIMSWSWEEFFFSTFDLMKKHVSLYCTIGEMKSFLHSLLDASIEAISCNYELGFDHKRTISHRVFFRIWEEMEKNENTKFDISELEGGWFDFFLLNGLYKGFDILILNVLLSPLDEDRRKYYLEKGQIYYKEIIRRGQYELIETFIKVVLKSKELEWFIKNQLNFIADFKEENNRDAVEKILGWQLSYQENQKK